MAMLYWLPWHSHLQDTCKGSHCSPGRVEGEAGQGRGGPPQGPQIQADCSCHSATDFMEEAPIQQGVVREKEEGSHCYSGAAKLQHQ